MILVSDDALRTALQMGASAASAVCIKLRDREDSVRVAERVRALLIKRKYRLAPAFNFAVPGRLAVARDATWTGLRLDVSTWQTDLRVMAWAVGLVRGIGGAIVGFLLMITIFGVTNALWLSVRERTREIGTLRAIGMSRIRVLLLIMFEAALLAMFGAAIGVALGGGLVAALSAANIELGPGLQHLLFSQTLNLHFEPRAIAGGVVVVVFVTAIFALYPAYRAARLRPATAIHHAG